MEHRITHACGHEQAHYIPGFAAQQARKAHWLQTTMCRDCFAAEKRSAHANATTQQISAIAHFDLPPLVGSERQMSWAATIRAKRLAALVTTPGMGEAVVKNACHRIADAKWWIDHRDVSDVDLIAKASLVIAA